MSIRRPINNRQEFIEYCKRKLGHPVLLINVDGQQFEDRVNDALDMFHSYHTDGSTRQFVAHQLTQNDIDRKRIEIDKDIISVLRVVPIDGTKATINLEYQMFITEIMNIRKLITGGIHGYAITSSYLNTINEIFNYEKTTEFNLFQHYLTINADWSRYKVGDYVVMECDVIVDPEKHALVWNDPWLKEYATALIKKQWGQNLSKFSGAQLPGGITMNGELILNEAKEEIANLEERLRNEFQDPLEAFMG